MEGNPHNATLLVFADDWARHPSSCQHLIRELLPRYTVLWVNTIGTRRPAWDLLTLRRGVEKVRGWLARGSSLPSDLPQNLTVLNPSMWPTFSPRGRRLNRRLLVRQLTPALRDARRPVVALTTLPITADLMDSLDVDRWIYYCVDDFSVWPGLDGHVLGELERTVVDRADVLIAVNETLRQKLEASNKPVTVVTHGVDLRHWRRTTEPPTNAAPSTDHSADVTAQGAAHAHSGALSAPSVGPRVVFWGVVDRRLDLDYLAALDARMTSGEILLVGPTNNPDPAIARLAHVRLTGAMPFDELPQLAVAADVLVMPYADLPVTRAMQPLKLKEYLATGRPVVARNLPAVEPWADCLDMVGTAEDFASAVLDRARLGLPASQAAARRRLNGESWSVKAEVLESLILQSGRRAAVGCS